MNFFRFSKKNSKHKGSLITQTSNRHLVPPPVRKITDLEHPSSWGFRDSYFFVNKLRNVRLAGDRYPISGLDLPYFLPWIEDTLNITLNTNEPLSRNASHPIPPSRANPELIASLEDALSKDRVFVQDEHRERRAHGHALEEMLSVRNLGFKRIPDVVVEPKDVKEITLVIEIARNLKACLMPFGGGTNVSLALRCPEDENKPIISIDMKRMNKIHWVNRSNHTAKIEAGAIGRDIQTQLSALGFTLGHEPDSIEFSTLGGWIATRASGMKKNQYGNIEDIVLGIEAVSRHGPILRQDVFERESTGPELKDVFLGSEGALGIITSATVKIFPLPKKQTYGSVVFRNFNSALEFLYELSHSDDIPASVRLVDNLQFQFGQALRPKPRRFTSLTSKLKKFYLTKVLSYDLEEISACTLVYEGNKEICSRQKKKTLALAKRFGGISGGSENGKSGYSLTFNIAYIRDFALDYGVLGESFETSVPWSNLSTLCDNVKKLVFRKHKEKNLPGSPFISCRVTQLYKTGACVYFYFAFYAKDLEAPEMIFADIERDIRYEILRSGGSISHHHGVGKLRQRFLKESFPDELLSWRKDLKQAMDPEKLFGPGNLIS